MLTLKLFDDCYIPDFADERIKVWAETVTDERMARWYNELHCFVSLAKGEGWGLHVQEALACGVPVMAPAYSGLADLVPNSTLPFTIVPASESYQGHWCQPDLEEVSRRMRNLADDWVDPIPKKVVTVEQFAQGVKEALQ